MQLKHFSDEFILPLVWNKYFYLLFRIFLRHDDLVVDTSSEHDYK